MWQYRAQLVKVVDGDTIDLTVDVGFHLAVTDRFRLYGLNTPERGLPGWGEATQFVKEWFAVSSGSCIVWSVKPKQDKYGRYLVTVVHDEVGATSLNEGLVANGLAVPYFP